MNALKPLGILSSQQATSVTESMAGKKNKTIV